MTQRAHAPQETIDRLLEAAFAVVAAGGAQALTLDAVARQAKVSKGGLLHHFPSKKALVLAMVEALYARFNALADDCFAREAARPGRWLRAYIHASFSPDAPQIGLDFTALLAGDVADNPALMERVATDARMWAERLTSDGIPAARAAVIRYACDGYFSERMLGMSTMHADADAVRAHLLALAEA